MKFSISILLALLSIPLAFASLPDHLAEEDYIAVVRDDAPAGDVVFTANFAQTMKAQTGAAFIGAVESDVEDASEDELREKIVVFLDGQEKTAQIVIGEDARRASSVRDAASEYLEDAGYDVSIETIEEEKSRSSRASQPAIEEEPIVIEPVEVIAEDIVVVAPISVTVNNTTNETNNTTVIPEMVQVEIKEDVEAEKTGLLTRFFSWLSGLFG